MTDTIEGLRAELAERTTAFRLRATAAHEAVNRARMATTVEALAALDDDGYVHLAVHAMLDFPASASLPSEAAAHIERQDRRIEGLEAANNARGAIVADRDHLRKLCAEAAAHLRAHTWRTHTWSLPSVVTTEALAKRLEEAASG